MHYSGAVFYRFVRAIIGFALHLFYHVEVSSPGRDFSGPVIYVGNHPNGLIDPALIFIISDRPETFLAKAPLFRMPVIGWILRRLRALPVHRKQDDPSQMHRNESTLESAIQALVGGGAITLFPEGKSHSEPSLADLKTGTARIALGAARPDVPVKIVPVGLTYAEKNRFRSQVLIEVGDPIVVSHAPDTQQVDLVRNLTAQIAEGLRRVTLNLDAWEDLALIQFADSLYTLRTGDREGDPRRIRNFAGGAQLFRREEFQRFEQIRRDLMSFREQLKLARANPRDLALEYRTEEVMIFIARNLLVLTIGLPLFASGIILFAIPFQLIRQLSHAIRAELDIQATVKFLATLVIAPLWWALLTTIAWTFFGTWGGISALLGLLPLAVFTRYFLEHWKRVLQDVQTFFVLGSRARLRERLLRRGDILARDIEGVANKLRHRLATEA